MERKLSLFDPENKINLEDSDLVKFLETYKFDYKVFEIKNFENFHFLECSNFSIESLLVNLKDINKINNILGTVNHLFILDEEDSEKSQNFDCR